MLETVAATAERLLQIPGVQLRIIFYGTHSARFPVCSRCGHNVFQSSLSASLVEMTGTSSADEGAGVNGTSTVSASTGSCSGTRGAGAGGNGVEEIGTSSASRGAGAGDGAGAGGKCTGMLLPGGADGGGGKLGAIVK